MKALRIFFLFVCIVIFYLGAQEAIANVYASDIRITNPDDSPFDGNFLDGTGARINFVLNDTASTVTVRFVDIATGLDAFTINAGSLGKGQQFVEWDGTGAVSGHRYLVSLTAEQATYSNTDYVLFTFVATSALEQTPIFTRGVDSNNDPTSRNFGFIYAGNDDAGGRLRTGILRYRSDAEFAGTDFGDPMLLSTLGNEHSGGSVDWGTNSPWHATLDYLGRIYASGVDNGRIYRVDSNTSEPQVIIDNLTNPRGLALVGKGENLQIYIAQDRLILRANIGTSDSLSSPLDTIAMLDTYVRDVSIDDDGFLYATVRTDDGTTQSSEPGAVEKYDISGSLPVTSLDAVWSIVLDGRPIGLAIDRGASPTNSDDILYFTLRSGFSGTSSPGLYRIDDIESLFAVAVDLWKPNDHPPSAGGNVSFNSDLTIDAVGNILYFENGNEELVFLSPPSSNPTNSYTTLGVDTLQADVATSVHDELARPKQLVLFQNYPNPFNPETTIKFLLPRDAFVTLKVYDVVGREHATLVEEYLATGNHSVVFRAGHLSSGTYLYVIQAGEFTDRKKMVLVK